MIDSMYLHFLGYTPPCVYTAYRKGNGYYYCPYGIRLLVMSSAFNNKKT
jgi:hypothetical protein